MRRSNAARPNRRFARMVTRSLAVLLVLTMVSAAVGFHYWTDPVTVRRLVLERLRLQFPGAEVSLDTARLWPGWGIAVTNLTLSRRDDPSLTPVLQVPSGQIEADAAQLASGRLRVGRVKLERARITAVRNREGHWNFDGLLAPPQPNLPLPTIVFERGTLVVRVATPAGGESVWEMGKSQAAVIENRPGLAHFECRCESDRLGPLALQGVWKRRLGEVDLGIDLQAMPVNMEILNEINRFAPLPMESVRHCSGLARVRLDAHRGSGDTTKWKPKWRLKFDQGRLGLRELPIDLSDIVVDATVSDGRLTVKDARAMAGDAPVHAAMIARTNAATPADAVESAGVHIEHFLVTPELFSRLPERAQRFQQRFAPVGRMSLHYQFIRRETDGWDARIELNPENVSGRYHKFPYPLRHTRGHIVTELASDHAGRHSVDITCEAGGGDRVKLQGIISGDEPCPAIDLRISGTDGKPSALMDVDEELISSLPPKFQAQARSFDYRGRIALSGRIHRPHGIPVGHDQYLVHFHNARVCYDAFPLPLEHVSGELHIHLGPGLPDDPNIGDHWKLTRAGGVHGTGRVTFNAHDEPTSNGKRLVIDLGGEQLPLDEPLARALAIHRLGPVWDMLTPSGAVNFTSRIAILPRPEGSPDAEVTLKVAGATLQPRFFPYALCDLSAHLHATKGRVILGECTARHGETQLRFSGAEVRTHQGLWVDLRDIQATRLKADPDLVQALPPVVQKAMTTLKPHGSFAVELKRLVLHDPPAIPGPPGPPVLSWDGSLALQNAGCATGVSWSDLHGTIACRGSVRGNRLEWLNGHVALNTAAVVQQPLTKVHAQIFVDPETPDVLQVRGVSGKVFDGDVTGEARVVFGSGLDYALDVKLLGGQLQEFAKHNRIGDGRLTGKTTAQLYLSGRGTAPEELIGRGEIDVPAGKIYDLPLLLELLKATTLRAPDGVAFDEAHAVFKVRGRRLLVERVDLLGTAVSLGGHGSLDLNGDNVDLDFYAVWARIAQVLPVGWRDLPPWLSQQLLRIKMRGTLATPTFSAEPVPFLVEPVTQLLEAVNRRSVRPPQRRPEIE